jgi:amino acid transporter
MAPVAGSAYTYAYATLGELLAWIIGWDLILEYAMSAAVVAASWSKYFNELLQVLGVSQVPDHLCHDPFSQPGAWFNLPAVLILVAVTTVLVIGIRESAASNTTLVAIKVGVVVFVVAVGAAFVNPANWTDIPPAERKQPQELVLPEIADAQAKAEDQLLKAAREWVQQFPEEAKATGVTVSVKDGPNRTLPANDESLDDRVARIRKQALAATRIEAARASGDPEFLKRAEAEYGKDLPQQDWEKKAVAAVLARAKEKGEQEKTKRWGLLGTFGLSRWLAQIDDATRTRFMPYGFSGMMLGAALVFFAFLGFDSVSTHAEEAKKPQRDVPIGILASLVVCTLLYALVSAVITGMEPYYDLDPEAAVASAFRKRAEADGGWLLRISAGLIALGALAGMTSVLLITLLSQARIFLAMARDRLMPPAVFGAVHRRFRTPHLSTMLTGGLMALVAAFTPIETLEEMVNIGTFFAFVVVCAAVLILRVKRPEALRPFRCPVVYVVAPLGIFVNVTMMLFLAVDTWLRLVVWLALGLVIYFSYGYWRSLVGKEIALGLPSGTLTVEAAHAPHGDGEPPGAEYPETGIKKADGQPGREGT